MLYDWLHLLLSPACLVLLFILHLLCHRLLRMESIVVSFFISFVLAFLVFVGISVGVSLSSEDSLLSIILIGLCNFMIFFCGAYVYINVLNIGNASIRVYILALFSRKPDGLSEEEILAQYNSQTLLNSRIMRLKQSGQLNEDSGRYFLGEKKRQIYIAKFFVFWRYIIFGL